MGICHRRRVWELTPSIRVLHLLQPRPLKRWRFSELRSPRVELPAEPSSRQSRMGAVEGIRIVNSKDTRLLNRREFSGLCVALGSFVNSSGASALDAASGVGSIGAGRTVKFRDGTVIPALGQGSAGLGK